MSPKIVNSNPINARPPIDDSSLNHIPEDAVPGYEKRIYDGVDWTSEGITMRRLKQKWLKDDIFPLAFTEAYKNKLNKSILREFLNENSKFTFEQLWEFIIPVKYWELEKFGNEEAKICFNSDNCITDNVTDVLKKALKHNNRRLLNDDLKDVTALRINNSKMTHLDETLLQFRHVKTLNLCDNNISEIDAKMLPPDLIILELQANRITKLESFVDNMPFNLMYLGLARNPLIAGFHEALSSLPNSLTVIDFSDNDICELMPVLEALVSLPNLKALSLVGNPCSVCAGFAVATLIMLPNLEWLDGYDVPRGNPKDMPHPDDLRSAYFVFNVVRIVSATQPPALNKGVTDGFHVELEIPLLDSQRTQFLMCRSNESLTEFLMPPEDEPQLIKTISSVNNSSINVVVEPRPSPVAINIYDNLSTKNLLEIHHYTTMQSTPVQWNNVMAFPEPAVRIFCPNLSILRDTFRSAITVRLVYTQVITNGKAGKNGKKISQTMFPEEKYLVLATVRCSLRPPVWCQPLQHFHWDDSLGTKDAVHWQEGNLSVLQYGENAKASQPSGTGGSTTAVGVDLPENLTCHFSFGIEIINPE